MSKLTYPSSFSSTIVRDKELPRKKSNSNITSVCRGTEAIFCGGVLHLTAGHKGKWLTLNRSGCFIGFNYFSRHLRHSVDRMCEWAGVGGIANCDRRCGDINAGGDRDYIEAAFGRRVSFAYTWTMFFVIKSGAQVCNKPYRTMAAPACKLVCAFIVHVVWSSLPVGFW